MKNIKEIITVTTFATGNVVKVLRHFKICNLRFGNVVLRYFKIYVYLVNKHIVYYDEAIYFLYSQPFK